MKPTGRANVRPVSGGPHLDAAEGVSGFGEILVKAYEGLTAFRLGQMQPSAIASMPPFRLGGDPCFHIRDRLCRPLVGQGAEYAFRRVGAKAGFAFSNTPTGVSSTVSSVPAGQCRSSRIALGNITWPLVETVVVSFCLADMAVSFGKTEVR